MWILPVGFMISTILFGRVLDFGIGTLGLKVFYFIAVIRYIISPVLITITNGEIDSYRMSYLPDDAYWVAITVQMIELFIDISTIYFYYPRVVSEYMQKNLKPREKVESGIHLGGYLILVAFVLILVLRFPIWYPALNIYGIKTASEYGIVAENTLFSTVKTLLFVIFLSNAVKTQETRYFGNRLLVLIIWSIFCVITSFGSNRSFTLELFATILVITLHYFPKYKNHVIFGIVPISIAVIFNMIVTKQFGIETAAEFSLVTFDLQYVSNQLEEYTNGLWCIAQSYQSSIGLTITQRIQAIVKELTDALVVVLEMRKLTMALYIWVCQ